MTYWFNKKINSFIFVRHCCMFHLGFNRGRFPLGYEQHPKGRKPRHIWCVGSRGSSSPSWSGRTILDPASGIINGWSGPCEASNSSVQGGFAYPAVTVNFNLQTDKTCWTDCKQSTEINLFPQKCSWLETVFFFILGQEQPLILSNHNCFLNFT